MNKQAFLTTLKEKLSGLPQSDVNERLNFYSEMIDDRMEDGLSEEQAVSAIGVVDDIAAQIISETPLIRIVKEKITPKKRLRVWEIVLLVLGSPIWLSLLIAILAIIISLYVSLWSVVISLWAAFASVVAGALGGIASGIGLALYQNTLTGIALIGIGIVCAGVLILFFFVCNAVTKGMLLLTKKIAVWIKNFFIKREET